MSQVRRIVIARFPDLNEFRSEQGSEEWSDRRPRSEGRILSQGLSMKLLAGMAAALLLGAMLPFSLSSKIWKADSPAVADTVAPAWQPAPSSAKHAEAKPAATTAAPVAVAPPAALPAQPATPPAARPPVLVAARPEKVAAPANPTQPAAKQAAPVAVAHPTPAPPTMPMQMPMPTQAAPVTETSRPTNLAPPPQAPTMSAWPAQGQTAPQTPAAGIDGRSNQPMSVYQPSYQNDPRSVYQPR